uniref:Ig-like domain-containing protein n=2 Tax=Astatotilapia calliptera TaxID=8154 RepID=A0A3P8N747_ASTCA
MTVSWASLFFICLLPCTMGVSDQFQLEPMTAAVFKGSDAQFIARVTGLWEFMAWTVGQFLVLTVHRNTTILQVEQYSARFCSSDNSSCVEFTIHNVSRSLIGPVTCAVQGSYGEKTAQLSVQENGTISIAGPSMKVMYDQQVTFQCVAAGWYPKPTVTWTLNGNAMNSTLDNFTDNGDFFNSTSVLTFQAVRDTTVKCLVSIPALTSPQSTSLFLVVAPKPPNWTVLIAVVVSFGSLALLVLLIIGIWFCYKRRKEKQTNYQDEMRRVRTQSQLSGVHGPRNKEGQVNTAYVPEGQTSVPTSEITDNGLFQVSTVANSAQAGGAFYNFEDPGFIKHRHATIV